MPSKKKNHFAFAQPFRISYSLSEASLPTVWLLVMCWFDLHVRLNVPPHRHPTYSFLQAAVKIHILLA